MVLWGGWDLVDHATGDFVTIPEPHGYRHTYGAFHPDGDHFVTAAGADVPRLGRRDRRAHGQRAHFPSGKVTEIDYTEDGGRLVVSELDGTVTMLEAASMRRARDPRSSSASPCPGWWRARTGERPSS